MYSLAYRQATCSSLSRPSCQIYGNFYSIDVRDSVGRERTLARQRRASEFVFFAHFTIRAGTEKLRTVTLTRGDILLYNMYQCTYLRVRAVTIHRSCLMNVT